MLKKDSNRKFLRMTVTKRILCVFVFIYIATNISFAQNTEVFKVDYSKPKEYEIASITTSGIKYLDVNTIIMISGLNIGDKVKIPSDALSQAIRKLWAQGLAENIKIEIDKVEGDKVYLNIDMTERPRLRRIVYSGIRKSEISNLNTEINFRPGEIVTNYLQSRAKTKISKYYIDKGFLNCEVILRQVVDTSQQNSVFLHIDINKNGKVKIHKINILNNTKISDNKVRSFMSETKDKGVFTPLEGLNDLILDVFSTTLRLNFSDLIDSTANYFGKNFKIRVFKGSKLIRDNYNQDKAAIIEKYNTLGYRDAKIVKDSIYDAEDGLINIDLTVDEGPKYYFRNITWVGNTRYSAEDLDKVLKIKKGDIYNKERLDKSLNYNPVDQDVSSLYLDEGFLFFYANPVEVLVSNDSIDIEIRMNEGKQARINKVTLTGNTRTNDHVALREIRTRPGQLFSRELLIRTTRELSQLRYFDPETINPEVIPNEANATTDIEYQVEETSSDQVELSGGFGYGRVIGSLGFSFNNFSLKGLFKKEMWRPIPTGDGQKLAIKFQTYGKGYFNYSVSLTEPWFGGKKPNSLTVSYYFSSFSNANVVNSGDEGFQQFTTNGFTLGLGKRLTWPDDYFTLYQSVKFLLYDLENYSVFNFGSGTGKYNNFSYSIALGRNSTSQPIYPRWGSEFAVSLELTVPYSLFSDKDYTTIDEDEKYKWVEFYKVKFNTGWYFELLDKLVMSTRMQFGYMGAYNDDIGTSPFGRFYVGGDGLSGGYNMDGREIIAMRGYDNEVLPATNTTTNTINGGSVYTKYTLEVRYPLSLNPSATIYALAYVEAGNAWAGLNEYDPFDLYRTAGVGIRIFMPMFGFLGLDWGYGFDQIPGSPDANGAHFHFSMNKSID